VVVDGADTRHLVFWVRGGQLGRWFSAGGATGLLLQLTYVLAVTLAGLGPMCSRDVDSEAAQSQLSARALADRGSTI